MPSLLALFTLSLLRLTIEIKMFITISLYLCMQFNGSSQPCIIAIRTHIRTCTVLGRHVNLEFEFFPLFVFFLLGGLHCFVL
jgi:hypothetical protein